jgi:hypothetical protein
MAGFEVITYGRFWPITEGLDDLSSRRDQRTFEKAIKEVIIGTEKR